MLLAWEQGTGKTVISLAAAEKLIELGKVKNVLVIGRPSDYFQWRDKIHEFTDSDCTLVTAKDKASRAYKPTNRAPYVITHWNLFRSDYATISKRSWDLIIADEAQEFRNWKSKTSKLIKRKATRVEAKYRWALTGTAISNKLEDLYNLMYWVDSDFLPPWPTFEKRHCVRGAMGLIVGYKNLKALHAYLEKRMDRKTHDDFKGELPELIPQIEKVPQSAAYRKAETKLLRLLDAGDFSLTVDNFGNAVITGNSKVTKAFLEVREQLASESKLRAIIDWLERILAENPRNRVVLFSGLKEPLYQLQPVLQARGIKCTLFTGDQDLSAKQANLADYQYGSTRVLLASNAGKAGLDLKTTNYVGHIDVPPSHEIDDQRNKRHTRIGSLFSSVVAVYFIVEDSVEEFYYQVVRNKGILSAGALEGKHDKVTIRPTSLREHIRSKREKVR